MGCTGKATGAPLDVAFGKRLTSKLMGKTQVVMEKTLAHYW